MYKHKGYLSQTPIVAKIKKFTIENSLDYSVNANIVEINNSTVEDGEKATITFLPTRIEITNNGLEISTLQAEIEQLASVAFLKGTFIEQLIIVNPAITYVRTIQETADLILLEYNYNDVPFIIGIQIANTRIAVVIKDLGDNILPPAFVDFVSANTSLVETTMNG